MSNTDVDEFDLMDDFSSIPVEDLIRLDAVVASEYALMMNATASVPKDRGGPAVEVQVEEIPADPSSSGSSVSSRGSLADLEPDAEDCRSPLQRFRRNGILFVTDIASPAWCGVQFEYGLRQKRHIGLEHRPKSFTSRDGKKIAAELKVAKMNDQIVRRGASVHKKLEREIRPEETAVEINLPEERWGLRLINMLQCLDSLLAIGRAREMPIFGIVHGQTISGVIDELVRVPVKNGLDGGTKRPSSSLPGTPQKLKRSRTAPSPSRKTQSQILQLFPKSPSKRSTEVPLERNTEEVTNPSPEREKARHMLRLIDTKTRQSRSVPSDEDTLSARIQLMLYRRLLNDLLETSPPFDFTQLWDKLGLDTTKTFSDQFMKDTQLASNSQLRCLADFSQLWLNMVPDLDVDKVDRSLQIVYRLRVQSSQEKKLPKSSSTFSISREEEDLAKAIEASLSDLGRPTLPEEVQTFSKNILGNKDSEPIAVPEVNVQIETATSPQISGTCGSLVVSTDPESALNESDPSSLEHSPAIVGTKRFPADDDFLDHWLEDTLLWWNGKRRPRGVELHQTKRCNTCEYRVDCEWREEKASEIADQIRQRRQLGAEAWQ